MCRIAATLLAERLLVLRQVQAELHEAQQAAQVAEQERAREQQEAAATTATLQAELEAQQSSFQGQLDRLQAALVGVQSEAAGKEVRDVIFSRNHLCFSNIMQRQHYTVEWLQEQFFLGSTVMHISQTCL